MAWGKKLLSPPGCADLHVYWSIKSGRTFKSQIGSICGRGAVCCAHRADLSSALVLTMNLRLLATMLAEVGGANTRDLCQASKSCIHGVNASFPKDYARSRARIRRSIVDRMQFCSCLQNFNSESPAETWMRGCDRFNCRLPDTPINVMITRIVSGSRFQRSNSRDCPRRFATHASS